MPSVDELVTLFPWIGFDNKEILFLLHKQSLLDFPFGRRNHKCSERWNIGRSQWLFLTGLEGPEQLTSFSTFQLYSWDSWKKKYTCLKFSIFSWNAKGKKKKSSSSHVGPQYSSVRLIVWERYMLMSYLTVKWNDWGFHLLPLRPRLRPVAFLTLQYIHTDAVTDWMTAHATFFSSSFYVSRDR